MQKLSKLLFLFVLCTLYFVLHPTGASAQVPGFKIPCDTEKDPEFDSLRPYQASPCGDSTKAYFCGNNIKIKETIHRVIKGRHISSYNPHVNVTDKPYYIDLSGTEFPILGNTEDVKNSQNPEDSIDDATKMNEYASWYLNGVINRAEYGTGKNSDNEIINFSGPIQKLMPSILLEAKRIEVVNSPTINATFINEEDSISSDLGGGVRETSPINHNQIVVCANENILGFGQSTPIECYEGNKSGTKGTKYRLQDWSGDLSWFNNLVNRIGGEAWNKKTPPLPWADEDGKPFKDAKEYQKAYNEWRGEACLNIPLIDKLLCVDNPLVANKWAKLFPYVPLANTSDKSGKMMINTVTIQPSAQTELASSSYVIEEEPSHYYPHTQEVKDLSEFLNQTYTPQGVKAEAVSETTENNKNCSIINVRSNPGDDLFPVKQPADIRITASYNVTQIPCKEGFDKNGVPESECEGEIYIGIQTNPVKVPWANEIWKSTVADSTSTFRKIFPKVGEGAPVTCIADIPSVTKAVYTPVEGADEIGVEGPLTSAQQSEMDPQDAKIYFPHIGSIYEYFLKGIQTALRPKGYGEPITDGALCNNIKCGELPKLPSASGSCKLGGISSRVGNIPQSLKDIISAASETYKVPPNLILARMYGEGSFNQLPYQKFDWTDENVVNWATCTPIPGCSDSVPDNWIGFNGYFDNILAKSTVEDDIKKIDPGRVTLSQCNLLDGIFAAAWDLHSSAGGGSFAGNSCFGITMTSSIPTLCTWQDGEYESAIKMYENGNNAECFTRKTGCMLGDSVPSCSYDPNGDPDCEVNGSHSSDPSIASHNACVWDVAHGN